MSEFPRPADCPGTCDTDATACTMACGEPSLAATLDHWQREAKFGQFDTGRYDCRYFVWGEGPPLVFIHGLADQARSFVPVMALLRSQFRCVGYELPGGLDDGARLGSYRHDDLRADLLALVDHLGMQRSYLFGSSFGSTIALSALVAQPERIPRCVLQGGFARRPLSKWERRISQFLRYRHARLGDLWLRRHLQQFIDGAEHAAFRKSGRDAEWEFLKSNSNEASCMAAARRALALDRFDFRGQLMQIRQPVLLIVGEADSIVPESCAKAVIDGLPNAARIDIPDCGHYPQYTHAGLIAELIRQFLTQPTTSHNPDAAADRVPLERCHVGN